MATIEIRNIGPIREATFDLKKVNVFMGSQSSGKSTIAKLISYCTWVEKEVATGQSLKKYRDDRVLFKDCLEYFHKIKGYFRADSYLSYRSGVVEMKWENEQSTLDWVDRYAYRRSKMAYIPADRNMIILPEVRKVTFSDTNVRSFLFDWFDARKKYSRENKLPLLDLKVDYYYSEGNDEDHIVGTKGDDKYDILLSNASSGLQSLTPLVLMVDYLTTWIYKENIISFEQEEKRRRAQAIIEDVYDERTGTFSYQAVQDNLFKTKNIQFILEEPEQNLFPETQKELIYHLLRKCVTQEGNRLTITTHSPYILYAMNNCMMGHLVKEKMVEDDGGYADLKSLLSSVDPTCVGVWQITDEGTIKNIQGEDFLIEGNYFDACMKGVMDDFYKMINYYGDEDEDEDC